MGKATNDELETKDVVEPEPQVVTDDAVPAEEPPETPDPKATADGEPAQTADADDDEPKGKPRKSARRRIGELTKARRTAEAEAETVKRENAELKEKLAKVEKQDDEKPEPTRDNFETEEDFIKSYTQWYSDKSRAEAETKVDTTSDTPAAQATPLDRETLLRWKETSEAGAEKYDDFNKVITNPGLPITPDMVAAMADQEDGHEVAYHLGQHPEECARIAALPVEQQYDEIALLEDKLQAPSAPNGDKPPTSDDQPAPAAKTPAKPKAKVTNAPKPPTPAPTHDTVDKSPEDMSQDEYERARRSGKLR